MSVLMTLYITAMMKMKRGTVQTVPFNSKTWFDEMIRRVQNSEPESWSGSRLPKTVKSDSRDELILLDGGEPYMNIGYCRDGVIVNMRDVLPKVDSLHSPRFDQEADLWSRKGSTSSAPCSEIRAKRGEVEHLD